MPRRRHHEDDVPVTLDDERSQVDRNAAGGGWEGAGEVVENDFEVEQLRRWETGDDDGGTPLGHDPEEPDPDEGSPEDRVRF